MSLPLTMSMNRMLFHFGSNSTYRSGFSFASRAVAALWTSGCGGGSGLQRINFKLVPRCTFGTPLLSRKPQALAPPGEVA